MKNSQVDRIWNGCIKNTTINGKFSSLTEKTQNKVNEFISRTKQKKGRNDIITNVQVATVGACIVAIRCQIQMCTNTGAIIGGAPVFLLCNESKFGNYYFNRIYKHSFSIDGTNYIK